MRGVPIVSVIMPSYNHKDYVLDAIESVINQRGVDFELDLVVIDDGSTDGSVDLLKQLHLERKEAFQLVIKDNEGLCKTLNRAVSHYAKGDYIAIIASDDMWAPEKLSTQLRCLLNSPEYGLCYSNAQLFGEVSAPRRSSRFLFSGQVKSLLTLYNFIPAGTVLYRRSLFDAIGGYDTTGLLLEDWDFLIRAANKTRFIAIDSDLLLYRIHGESSLAKMRQRGILYAEKRKVLVKNSAILNPLLRQVALVTHFALDVLLRKAFPSIKLSLLK